MAVTAATWLKAQAFAGWVRRTIGSPPTIVEKTATLPDGSRHEYLSVEFSEQQREQFVRWLDEQAGGVFESDREPSDIQIDFGGILLPWSIRYLLPAGIGLFGVGWLTRGLIGRR